MEKRWMLTEVFRDAAGGIYPVASAYGARWRMPCWPDDENTGKGLVEIYTTPDHIAAAKLDPMVVVCPDVEDQRPVPQVVVDAYASWGATPGMNMKTLLFTLADTEPIFTTSWS